MRLLGIGIRDVLSLAREARAGSGAAAPIVVSGPGAPVVADALREGGRAELVSVGGASARVGAVVRILEHALTTADVEVLRAASRAGVPLVVLHRGDLPEEIPYVLATDVLAWQADAPVPLDALAQALVGGWRGTAAVYAAGLPSLRGAAVERQARDTALAAAALAAVRSGAGPQAPVLALMQARMLRRIEVARGVSAPDTPAQLAAVVGPELGGAVITGALCRTVVRALPVRTRLLDAAVAYGGTRGLGAVAARLLDRR